MNNFFFFLNFEPCLFHGCWHRMKLYLCSLIEIFIETRFISYPVLRVADVIVAGNESGKVKRRGETWLVVYCAELLAYLS